MAPDPAWPSALLLDLQGVLIEDQRALPGAVDTVTLARRRGVAIRFVTNTATRHHDDLLQDLQQLGFGAEPCELATAPLAARSWLEREHRHPLALVHPAIAPLFAGSSAEPPDCVLLGDGRDLLSYANLNAALELLMQGAPLIGIGRGSAGSAAVADAADFMTDILAALWLLGWRPTKPDWRRLLAAPDHSSSAAPRGMSLICLRPSLISNSSPGSSPSWAV
ncbi:MAG: hypothetical protein ACKOPS_22900 [Cyanobium sp.]